MKKFLSLVLALVMTMSLVTISAGAKDFADDEKITYDEAVAVISEIGVVDGYEDGNFNPQGSLTRGAAAKIICNMILGPTTAAELHADTAPYKDVPTNHTFAGYIAYCAKEGIISGYADGTFRPAGTLTGYAFMKMLLGALGYDAEIEGYTGANWSINVAKQAINVGLNKSLEGEFNGIKAVNREEAALYAFNTLKADLVEYDTTINTTINGQTVTVGNSKAKAMEWLNSASRQRNIKDDKYIQFAEQYFTKLYLTEGNDVFGRPDREWEYKGKDIGAYVNHDLLVETYTEKVTGKMLYDLLGKNTVEDYDFDIYIDGETQQSVLKDAGYFTVGNIVKTNTEKVGATGDGVTTEVYVDVDAKEVTIAIINTYLAKAEGDYNEKKDEVSFEVWSVDDVTNKGNLVKDTDAKETLKVSEDDIDNFDVTTIEEDDIVIVTVAEGEIQTIAEPEVLEKATITAFKEGSNITVDGEKITYNDSVQYDDEVLDDYDDKNLKDTSYNVFLDANGFLIGVEIVDEASEYLFLTGMDGSSSNLTNKNVDANVILLDGTMDTVKVNMSKSEDEAGNKLTPDSLMNTWCTYTVDKNGVYTLTEVAKTNNWFTKDEDGDAYDKAGDTDKVGQAWMNDPVEDADKEFVTIDKKHVTLDGIDNSAFKKVYGNDSSVYINVETDNIAADVAAGDDDVNAIIISDVDSISTGVQSTSLKAFNANAVIASDKDYADIDAKYTSHGVYTLFKDNGYVIAAVVVGEDDGTTSNFAFVTSKSMNREAYDSTEDEYTWTREAVVNGEVVTLTETGDSNPEIRGMKQGEWYEVKYYADGTVRSVNELPFAGVIGKYIDKITLVEDSVDDNDTVVLWTDMTKTENEISVKGNTLQVDTATGDKYGFAVSASAKVILVQDTVVDGKTKLYEDIFDYDNGVKGLEKAVKDLNDNSAFVGYIGAVFEDGLATSVVIYDKTATDIDTGDTIVPDDNYDTKVVLKIGDGVIDVQDPDKEGTDAIAAEIVRELNARGYEDVAVQVRGGKVDGAVATKNSIEYTFKVNLPKEDPPAKDENA